MFILRGIARLRYLLQGLNVKYRVQLVLVVLINVIYQNTYSALSRRLVSLRNESERNCISTPCGNLQLTITTSYNMHTIQN